MKIYQQIIRGCGVCVCVLMALALEAALHNTSVETGLLCCFVPPVQLLGHDLEHISTSLGHLSQFIRSSPGLHCTLWVMVSVGQRY